MHIYFICENKLLTVEGATPEIAVKYQKLHTFLTNASAGDTVLICGVSFQIEAINKKYVTSNIVFVSLIETIKPKTFQF